MSESVKLPEGWVWTTLRRCLTGVEKIDPRALGRLDFQYVDISSVDADTATVKSPQRVPISSAPSRARQLLRSGDTIFSTVRPNLRRIAFIENTLDGEIGSTGFFVLRPSGVLFSRFVFHFVQTAPFIDAVCAKARGVSYPAVRPEDILDEKLPLPPLAEQHRIVEALEEQLSRLDTCNTSLDAAEKKLVTFTDRIITDEVGRLNPGSIPLSELLSAKPRNGRSVPTAEEGFPVLRLTALRGDKVDLTQFKIGDWIESTAEPFLVRHKDILLSRGNGSLHLVGRAALVKDHPEPVAYPDTMIRIKPDLNRLDPAFFVRYWNSPSIRRQVETKARTTAGIYKINQSVLQDILFPNLSIDVQRKISSEIDDFNSQNSRIIAAVGKVKISSARLRASLLESAFAGTLVDQDPADEPASTLLERIAAERAHEKPTVRRRTSGRIEVKV